MIDRSRLQGHTDTEHGQPPCPVAPVRPPGPHLLGMAARPRCPGASTAAAGAPCRSRVCAGPVSARGWALRHGRARTPRGRCRAPAARHVPFRPPRAPGGPPAGLAAAPQGQTQTPTIMLPLPVPDPSVQRTTTRPRLLRSYLRLQPGPCACTPRCPGRLIAGRPPPAGTVALACTSRRPSPSPSAAGRGLLHHRFRRSGGRWLLLLSR